MKTVPGFVLRPLGKEYILSAEGISQVNFNNIISLNKSAAYLWQQVEGKEGFTVEDLAKLLVEKYEIDLETATADAVKVARQWVEIGIATE